MKIKKIIIPIIYALAIFYIGFISGYNYAPNAEKVFAKIWGNKITKTMDDFWISKSKTKKIDNYWFLWPKDKNNNSIWIYHSPTAKPIVRIEDDNNNGIINSIAIIDKNENEFYLNIDEKTSNFKRIAVTNNSTNKIFIDNDFDCKFEEIHPISIIDAKK